MRAEVTIENIQSKYDFNDELKNCIKEVVKATLDYEECDFDAEVDVTITDNDNIRIMNRDYRQKDMPTDVLSFPMLEFDEDGQMIDEEFDMDNEAIILGDIVISIERANEQALEYGHSLKREIGFLTAHSMLHLLGYDHENDETAAKVMHNKEEAILSGLGILRN